MGDRANNRTAVAALFGLAMVPALSAATGPQSPQAASIALPVAKAIRLPHGAIAFIPEGTSLPAPVLVLLHGAGGDAARFLDGFKAQANRRKLVLLSLQSKDVTWPRRSPTAEADPDDVGAVIDSFSQRIPVDRERLTLLGFSDGASYALTLGLARPKLFRTVIALSPGYAFAPRELDRSQRIFIAHGRRDQVLPAANALSIVDGLERAGYRPQVRWFSGGHEVDRRALEEILDQAFGPAQDPRKSGTGGASR